MLAGWNDTAAAVPPATVPELFAAQAARAPDAVAVACGDGWCQLRGAGRARAGRLAPVLAGLGAGPESVVAVALDRVGAEMVVAVLGVWQAGAAYLPVDPGYPPGGSAFMLADARRGGAGRPAAGRAGGCRRGRGAAGGAG